MAPEELLTLLRIAHVSYLPALAKSLGDQYDEVSMETLCEVEDDRVLGGLLRFDAVVEGPKIHDLDAAPLPADIPEGMSLEIEGVPCAIMRSAWNACRVQARVDDDRWEGALASWLARWLDAEDKNPVDADGLSNVVHSIRDARVEDGMLSFVVDFGSAPIECVPDLFGSLVRLAGATFVVIGETRSLARTALN